MKIIYLPSTTVSLAEKWGLKHLPLFVIMKLKERQCSNTMYCALEQELGLWTTPNKVDNNYLRFQDGKN